MQFTIAGFEDLTSPFDLVQRILVSRDFLEPEKGDLGNAVIVLGDMTDEEKAIVTARRHTAAQLRQVALRGIMIADDMAKVEAEVDGLITEAELLNKWAAVINDLLWATLKTRFSERLAKLENYEIGVTNDHRIIARPEEDSAESLIAVLSQVFDSEHLCEECPNAKYNACALPFKKPRTEAPATNPTAP